MMPSRSSVAKIEQVTHYDRATIIVYHLPIPSRMLPCTVPVPPLKDSLQEAAAYECDHKGCHAAQLQARWRAVGPRDTSEYCTCMLY